MDFMTVSEAQVLYVHNVNVSLCVDMMNRQSREDKARGDKAHELSEEYLKMLKDVKAAIPDIYDDNAREWLRYAIQVQTTLYEERKEVKP